MRLFGKKYKNEIGIEVYEDGILDYLKPSFIWCIITLIWEILVLCVMDFIECAWKRGCSFFTQIRGGKSDTQSKPGKHGSMT